MLNCIGEYLRYCSKNKVEKIVQNIIGKCCRAVGLFILTTTL